MNDEIKKYIDTKISALSKLLNVCENCSNGIYQISNTCVYPAPLLCSECGYMKRIVPNTITTCFNYVKTESQKNINKNITYWDIEQLDESLTNLFDYSLLE